MRIGIGKDKSSGIHVEIWIYIFLEWVTDIDIIENSGYGYMDIHIIENYSYRPFLNLIYF